MNICTGGSFVSRDICPRRISCQIFIRGKEYSKQGWTGDWFGYRENTNCYRTELEARKDSDD